MTAALKASAAPQFMLPRHRAERLASLEYRLVQLARTEEALVVRALAIGKAVERRADAPPQAILQVKIARHVMAEKRAQRVERRQSRAIA
jgi:hypothetical protein